MSSVSQLVVSTKFCKHSKSEKSLLIPHFVTTLTLGGTPEPYWQFQKRHTPFFTKYRNDLCSEILPTSRTILQDKSCSDLTADSLSASISKPQVFLSESSNQLKQQPMETFLIFRTSPFAESCMAAAPSVITDNSSNANCKLCSTMNWFNSAKMAWAVVQTPTFRQNK